MPQRRIFITYPYPIGPATGGARMTREIARHLGKAGAQVVVFPVSLNFKSWFWPRRAVERDALGLEYDEELARDGVSIVRVPQHKLHWALDSRNVRRAVSEALEEGPADIVLSFYKESADLPALLRPRGIPFGFISAWQSYAAALLARAPGIPRFLTPSINRRLAIRPHQEADVLFASSRFTRGELVEHFGVPAQRIEICPLGVEPHFFDVQRSGPQDEVRRLLFFGRIIPTKGVGDALRALGSLARRGVPFELRLVGMGMHDWAREQAAQHGILDRIDIRGPAHDRELLEHLAWAQVSLLPSLFEAFGLAFAESQAAGLPVVAYAAGSVPEVVLDGTTGWLAPLRDTEALAACLEEALGSPAESMRRGAAAREHVRRSFTWHKTAATILAGVERLQSARPRSLGSAAVQTG